MQGELFLAFASILGVVGRARVNPGNEGCRKVAPRGSGPTELDVSIELCGGERPVTARFIRNELLSLDAEHNRRRRHPDYRFGAPALMLCDWHFAAASADLLVLNRGYHSLTDPHVDQQLAQLNETIAGLSNVMRSSGLRGGPQAHLRRRIVYRGTHGSLHNCERHPDPLSNESWSALSAKMGSRANAQYNWRGIEGREARTKQLLGSLGVPYLDTFVSTSYRPSGRMPGNCNHFCVPGPIDDWVRLLLAWWT